jgi:hypothetical protein
MGGESVYLNNIFYDNTIEGAGNTGLKRYDLAVNSGAKEVVGNFFNGALHDKRGLVSAEKNTLKAPPPNFDRDFVPQASEYKSAGYRPVDKGKLSDLR